MMCSQPRNASSASGRTRLWVSEMMPMRMTVDMGFARRTLWSERSTVPATRVIIPFLIQQCINDPGPCDDGTNPLMVQFKVAKRVAQMVFERVDAVEDAVVKRLFSQIVPEMFNRIEFR